MDLKIQEYLKQKGIVFKIITQNEIALKNCPFCNDIKFHLYMDLKDGLHHCKKCDSRGNFYAFRKVLGDEPQIKKASEFLGKPQTVNNRTLELVNDLCNTLLGTPSAIQYLESRGISLDTAMEFKIGYEPDWISIPHFVNGNPISIKYRKISQKEYRRLYGSPSVLFNVDNLDSALDYIIVTEGEFDAIKGHQEGIKNIVGTTLGAESFPEGWLKYFKDFKKVYICLDSDEIGQRGARKIAELIGLEKCANIILPEKDLNDYLLKYNVKDFKVLLESAKHFEIAEITKISENIDRFDEWLENSESIRGLETGFKKLDKILRGMKNEDLIIVSGESTTGKTTLALNMMLHLLKQGKKILAFLLEGRIFYFIQRLMSIEMEQPFTNITKEDVERLKKEFKDYHLYFYTGPQSGLEINKVVMKTTECKKLYNIDLIILDHLHKIVPRGQGNYSSLVGQTVSSLKNLAIDLKIPAIVICHVKKLKKKVVPRMQDLRDSSSIYQDADVILMLWANLDNPETRYKTVLKILKNKTGQDCVDIYFKFDRSTGQFIPIKSLQVEENVEEKPKKLEPPMDTLV